MAVPLNFQQITNFRDIATTSPTIKASLLYRSARPDSASPSDREILAQSIKTIVDLRTPTELHEQARKTGGKPMPIPGIDYVNVNFNGHAYSSALIAQLTHAQTAKLYFLYACGWRKTAISVLGSNVMAQRGLAGLAEDSLRHCRAEVKEVFDLLCHEDRYPLLLHCTQGKDRTGLLVLLVLLVCRVGVEAIEADYLRSGVELEGERAEKVREVGEIGLPEEFADTAKGWVPSVCGFLEREFGGVEKYLEGCGVNAQQQDQLRQLLMVRP